MDLLNLIESCGITSKKVANTNGGEYASPCPRCGGTDRFRIWLVTNRWWCRACDLKGDAIQFLIEFKNMNYRDACKYLNVKVRKRESGRTPKNNSKTKQVFNPKEIISPKEKWVKEAEQIVKKAHENLLKNKTKINWLLERGIKEESIVAFKLGWNIKDIFTTKTSWGLEDNNKKQWIPAGLVIPFYKNNQVERLRVRREQNENRYVVVSGSSMENFYLYNNKKAVVITESELDAILIYQEVGDIVDVSAQGNSSSKPDSNTHLLLKETDLILNALDSDEAGSKASLWWKEEYSQTERWMVPIGKDPGEYFKQGGNIREWILAGLPYGLRPNIKSEEPQQEAIEKKEEVAEQDKSLVDQFLIDRNKELETFGIKVVRYFCPGCKILFYLDSRTANKKEPVYCFDCIKEGTHEKRK